MCLLMKVPVFSPLDELVAGAAICAPAYERLMFFPLMTDAIVASVEIDYATRKAAKESCISLGNVVAYLACRGRYDSSVGQYTGCDCCCSC